MGLRLVKPHQTRCRAGGLDTRTACQPAMSTTNKLNHASRPEPGDVCLSLAQQAVQDLSGMLPQRWRRAMLYRGGRQVKRAA